MTLHSAWYSSVSGSTMAHKNGEYPEARTRCARKKGAIMHHQENKTL